MTSISTQDRVRSCPSRAEVSPSPLNGPARRSAAKAGRGRGEREKLRGSKLESGTREAACPYLRPARPYLRPARPYLRPARPYLRPACPYLRPACPYLRPRASLTYPALR